MQIEWSKFSCTPWKLLQAEVHEKVSRHQSKDGGGKRKAGLSPTEKPVRASKNVQKMEVSNDKDKMANAVNAQEASEPECKSDMEASQLNGQRNRPVEWIKSEKITESENQNPTEETKDENEFNNETIGKLYQFGNLHCISKIIVINSF